MQTRRDFLNNAVGGVVLSSAIPSYVNPGSRDLAGTKLLRESESQEILNKISSLKLADESYWRLVKEAFSLKPDLLLMHAANLCPSPIS
ncbi:uncharacterized protein METZ01_LOCUS177811, partial [marine metagenome]